MSIAGLRARVARCHDVHMIFGSTPAADPHTARAWLADGAAYAVDVRENDEWDAGRIDGATHIPMRSLAERLAELPADQRLLIVCRSGARSGQVTRALVQAGYDAVNLRGGMVAWVAEDLPIVPADGFIA